MKKIIAISIVALLCLFNQKTLAQQVPVANFTISPNPVCSGAVITIQDLSSNNPTAWSYTVAGFFPFPPPQVFTTQNPTLTFNGQGTYSIALVATNASGNSVPVTRTITVLPGANGNVNPANSNICLGEYVIMPNHFHGIIVINPAGVGSKPTHSKPARNCDDDVGAGSKPALVDGAG
ncbi:MAG: PKD domain-containing protein, partial [Bacteroidota bacterium]